MQHTRAACQCLLLPSLCMTALPGLMMAGTAVIMLPELNKHTAELVFERDAPGSPGRAAPAQSPPSGQWSAGAVSSMALCQGAQAIQCYHKTSARAFLTLSANPVMRPSRALVPRWVMPEYSVLAALRVQCSSLSSALVLAAAVSAATAQGQHSCTLVNMIRVGTSARFTYACQRLTVT